MCQISLVYSVSTLSEMSSSITYSPEKVIQATELKENTKWSVVLLGLTEEQKPAIRWNKFNCCSKYKAYFSLMMEICATQYSYVRHSLCFI